MIETIKDLLEKAQIDPKGIKTRELKFITGLDYRTIREIIRIYNYDNIEDSIIDNLLVPKYYTIENCLKLYQNDLEAFIPSVMYENELFVTKAKINKLPDNFISGDINIKEFTILPQIQYIGDNAFKDCANLRDIRGEKVISIGHAAFENCASLQTAYFPSVERFGNRVFKNNKELTVVTTSALTTFSESLFENCRNLTSINYDAITLSFAKIEARAFYNCLSLRELKVLCIYVGEDAFYNCKKIRSLYLYKPEVVCSGALENCRSLEEINFLNSSDEINFNLFNGCTNIKYIHISDYAYRLQYCNNMNTVIYRLREKNPEFKVRYSKNLQENLHKVFG